jgi:hypothetical protein
VGSIAPVSEGQGHTRASIALLCTPCKNKKYKAKKMRIKDLHLSLMDMSQLCFYYINPLYPMYEFKFKFWHKPGGVHAEQCNAPPLSTNDEETE